MTRVSNAKCDQKGPIPLIALAYLIGGILTASSPSPVAASEAANSTDLAGAVYEETEIARWTWLGIVESGGDPLDPKIEPGAPMRLEFVAERTALPSYGSQIHGPGDCEVEANLRLWVGDSVFELARARNSGECPQLNFGLVINGPEFIWSADDDLECAGRSDVPECAVVLNLSASGEGWCVKGNTEDSCSRVSVPHDPDYSDTRYWESASMAVRFLDDEDRMPNIWANAIPDDECSWSSDGIFYVGGDGRLPPRTPDFSPLPPGEVFVEVPFRGVEIRGRLFAPSGSRPRTAWAVGGEVVAVHGYDSDPPFDPADSNIPIGERLELDVYFDDSRPTSNDPCGVGAAGEPVSAVTTRIDYTGTPIRVEGRLGNFTIGGPNRGECGLPCEWGPKVDLYSNSPYDPLISWLPDRQRRANQERLDLGCDEAIAPLPPECSEPWNDPTNALPLDTVLLSTGQYWRATNDEGTEANAFIGILLQGAGGSMDPNAPLANAFETESLRTRRVIAGINTVSPGHFVEVELDRLEKISWICERPFFPGDANGDGAVDIIDQARIQENLGARYLGRDRGDVNCDGVVDDKDLAIWTENQRPPLGVPEPTFALGLLSGGLSLLCVGARRRDRGIHRGRPSNSATSDTVR